MNSPAMQAALDRIEGIPNARALRYLIQARTERRARVSGFMKSYRSLMTWLSKPCPAISGFMTTHEARIWLRKEIAFIRAQGENGHWAYNENAIRLPGLRDRLIVATYFDRFGARLWAREAA